jgi:hypothetical protein
LEQALRASADRLRILARWCSDRVEAFRGFEDEDRRSPCLLRHWLRVAPRWTRWRA